MKKLSKVFCMVIIAMFIIAIGFIIGKATSEAISTKTVIENLTENEIRQDDYFNEDESRIAKEYGVYLANYMCNYRRTLEAQGYEVEAEDAYRYSNTLRAEWYASGYKFILSFNVLPN